MSAVVIPLESHKISPKTDFQAFLQSTLAGGITGIINTGIIYPTEFVKTQLQLDDGKKLTAFAKEANVKTYSGSADVVRQTVARSGFLGLYRGMSAMMVGIVPQYAVRFGSYDALKNRLSDKHGDLSLMTRTGCGAIAGIVEAVAVVTWAETLKVRMIGDMKKIKPEYKGTFHAAKTIIKNEGLGGIYKGLTPTMIKQSSNQAIRFFVMESCKDAYTKGDKTVPIAPYVTAAFGGLSGATSVMGNNPIDVVKTRVQNNGNLSAFQAAKSIWQTHGIRGFYKGVAPRLNRVTIECAIGFAIFEFIKDYISKQNK